MIFGCLLGVGILLCSLALLAVSMAHAADDRTDDADPLYVLALHELPAARQVRDESEASA